MKSYQKVLIGSARTLGAAGLVAWKKMAPWIEHDLDLLRRTRRRMKNYDEVLTNLLIDKFEQRVSEHPKKAFIIFEDNIFTYELVDQMACKVANVAKSEWGLRPRDTVAMMVQNEPAFVWTFLGLQKLGITVALINYNLRRKPLVHSVKASEPKYFIVGQGDDLLTAVTDILEDLGPIKVFAQGLGSRHVPPGIQSFDEVFQHALTAPVCPEVRKDITLDDNSSYIYTSGTTGRPKPVYMSQAKSLVNGCALFEVGLTSTDRVYTVLPLYHSSGGTIGLNGTIITGATLVLRRKFSASKFWEDCRRHKVTVVQYIGELFRYLVAQPPSDFDSVHTVRGAMGNGLRKDIWEEFTKRFKIPQIVEFYGATEAAGVLMNCCNKPGAVGRISPFLNLVDPDPFPKVIVKLDYNTLMPLRDSNGRCMKVQIGEPGLALAKVPEFLQKNGSLEVYKSSREANESKLVRDAFQAGDLYFNYGDVLVLDKDYFVYFVDRLGDTFRWKGENVSTTEVANAIATLDYLQDANVYGVALPGHDGRAGMAAVTMKNGRCLGNHELQELYNHVCEELPSYARPLFLRDLGEPIMTGTFKQRKVELVAQGYDHTQVTDPLYYMDADNKTYSPLKPSDVSRLLKSKL